MFPLIILFLSSARETLLSQAYTLLMLEWWDQKLLIRLLTRLKFISEPKDYDQAL